MSWLDLSDASAPRLSLPYPDRGKWVAGSGSHVITERRSATGDGLERYVLVRYELAADAAVEQARSTEFPARIVTGALADQGRLLVLLEHTETGAMSLLALDTTTLQALGQLHLPGQYGSLTLGGEQLVLMGSEELVMVDISRPGDMRVTQTVPTRPGATPIFDGERFIVPQGFASALDL